MFSTAFYVFISECLYPVGFIGILLQLFLFFNLRCLYLDLHGSLFLPIYYFSRESLKLSLLCGIFLTLGKSDPGEFEPLPFLSFSRLILNNITYSGSKIFSKFLPSSSYLMANRCSSVFDRSGFSDPSIMKLL
jgi:hypothetical protein